MTIEGAIGLFFGALLLRIVGFIADFWLLVGAIVLVALWAYLARKFPEQKRLIKWIFIILILLNVMGTVGKNIYREHFEPYTRMSRAAVERARLAADLEAALKINPEMLKSRMEVTNHLQWVQDKYVGKWHEAKLANIRARLANETISPEAAWQEMMAVVKETKEYRKKITEAVSEISPPPLKPVGKDGIPWYDSIGARGWLALLGAMLLGATILLPGKITIPGRKFWGFVGIVMLLAAALWPQIAPPPQTGTPTPKTAPAAKMTRAAPEPPREPYEITVALGQDWSAKPVYLPAHAKCNFFGPKAKFRREADGFLGDTYTEYPDDPKFQSGLRFRLPEGQLPAGQRITIKVIPERS